MPGVDGRLSGKVALATGGSRGIGIATVRAFPAGAVHAAFLARHTERGRRPAAELTDSGAASLFLPGGVNAEAEEPVGLLPARYGRFDVLVNNARGVTSFDAATMTYDRPPDPAAAERSVAAVHPLGRTADPAEVAAVVAFPGSDQAGSGTGAASAGSSLSARFTT